MSDEKLVWIHDGNKMFLKVVHPWELNFDGTIGIDGSIFRWYPVTEFT